MALIALRLLITNTSTCVTNLLQYLHYFTIEYVHCKDRYANEIIFFLGEEIELNSPGIL